MMKVALIFLSSVFGIVFTSIGSGYVMSLLLPFSLFQAVMVCLLSEIVVMVFWVGLATKSTMSPWSSIEDFVCPECEAEAKKHRYANKVGRNDMCPCGSGKKYKHCCEKKRVDTGGD